jgi:biopolymer transport protein ExbD
MALKKNKARRNLQPINLNITSLIDVLTVIIFFLIQTMSISSESYTLPDNLKLPQASTEDKVQEAPVISITADDVRVSHDVLLRMDGKNRFPASELDGDGRTLRKLKVRLDEERQKQKQLFLSKGMDGFVPPGKILIQADKGLRFETVKYVLHTVASAGYTDFQFLVVPADP